MASASDDSRSNGEADLARGHGNSSVSTDDDSAACSVMGGPLGTPQRDSRRGGGRGRGNLRRLQEPLVECR